MKVGHSEKKTTYECHSEDDILQESMCERDLGVDMAPRQSPKHHIRIISKVVNYLLVTIKTDFKYIIHFKYFSFSLLGQ